MFPNYKVHAQYEYGNRVGIVRVLDLLDRHKLPVTVAANAGACEKYPYLVGQFRERDYEFAAHGVVRHAHALQRHERSRRACCDREFARHASNARPARGRAAGSDRTTASRRSRRACSPKPGCSYVADWGNDDQPYFLQTQPPLLSIPNQAEWDDVQLIWHRKVHPAIWRDSVLEAFTQLHADGAASGTVFGLHIHPWLLGQPHRIAMLEAVVEKITAAPDVWRTTAAGIAQHMGPR